MSPDSAVLQDQLVHMCTARCFLQSSGIRASQCGILDAHHTAQQALQGPSYFSWHKVSLMLGSKETHLLAPRHAGHMSCHHCYHWDEKNKDRCLLKGLERYPRLRECTALGEDLNSVPSTYVLWLTITCNSSVTI